MAYEIGTASSNYDLLTKIRTFLESTLPVGQRWTMQREVTTGASREVVWQAPGLSGTESICGGLSMYESIPSDVYNICVMACIGTVPANSFSTQPGISALLGVPLWNNAIPYWIIGNGQRVVVAVKIENVYQVFGLGKFFPYATPAQYPYPVIAFGALTNTAFTRYSDTTYVSGWKGSRANFTMRTLGGTWISPTIYAYSTTKTFRNTVNADATADGYYGLHPLVLMDSTNVYGELDGLYFISGYNNASENTLVVDGVTYIVFRDVYRTGFNDYIAMRLA